MQMHATSAPLETCTACGRARATSAFCPMTGAPHHSVVRPRSTPFSAPRPTPSASAVPPPPPPADASASAAAAEAAVFAMPAMPAAATTPAATWHTPPPSLRRTPVLHPSALALPTAAGAVPRAPVSTPTLAVQPQLRQQPSQLQPQPQPQPQPPMLQQAAAPSAATPLSSSSTLCAVLPQTPQQQAAAAATVQLVAVGAAGGGCCGGGGNSVLTSPPRSAPLQQRAPGTPRAQFTASLQVPALLSRYSAPGTSYQAKLDVVEKIRATTTSPALDEELGRLRRAAEAVELAMRQM